MKVQIVKPSDHRRECDTRIDELVDVPLLGTKAVAGDQAGVQPSTRGCFQ
eukprot:m.522270 g.522270  ORF g.522270 m.522270 type:complete len:50 (+) comp152459_c0_seq1:27-176(+)